MKFTLFFGINWSRLFRELVQSIFHQKDVLNFFSWLGFGPSKIWQIFVCLFTYLNKHSGSWKSPQMIIGPSSFQQKKPQLCSYPGLARNFFLARRYQNHKSSESPFIWRQSGISISFRLEMALVWIKMLPISVSQSLCKKCILAK